MRSRRLLLLLALTAATLRAQTVDGKQIFNTLCATCHGLDAHGGEHGPNISQLDPQEDVTAIVKVGAGKGMPAFGNSLNGP